MLLTAKEKKPSLFEPISVIGVTFTLWAPFGRPNWSLKCIAPLRISNRCWSER